MSRTIINYIDKIFAKEYIYKDILPLIKRRDYINTNIINFKHLFVTSKLNQKWTAVNKVFSNGNTILDSLTKPLQDLKDKIEEANENKFLASYKPDKNNFYITYINTIDEHSTTLPIIHAITKNNTSININNIKDNNIDNVKLAIYDRLEYAKILLTDVTFDSSYILNTLSFKVSDLPYNNKSKNLQIQYYTIVPSLIYITIKNGDSFYSNTKIPHVCKVKITGARNNGTIYSEELTFYDGVTQSTKYEYKSIINVEVKNILPITSDIYIDTIITIRDDALIKTKNFKFTDIDGTALNTYYQISTDSNDEVNVINLITNVSYNKNVVLAGINDLDTQVQFVINGPIQIGEELSTYNISTYYDKYIKQKHTKLQIDPFNDLLWTLTNGKLYLYKIQIDFPYKYIIDLLSTDENQYIGLYTSTQFPTLNEVISVSPVTIQNTTQLTSLRIDVIYNNVDINPIKWETGIILNVDDIVDYQGTLYKAINTHLTTTFIENADNLILYSPMIKTDDTTAYIPNLQYPTYYIPEYTSAQYTLDEPCTFVFEITAKYDSGETKKNYLVVKIPLLKHLAVFDLTTMGDFNINESTDDYKLLTFKNGEIGIINFTTKEYYKIKPKIDKFIISNNLSHIIYTDRYKEIEVHLDS